MTKIALKLRHLIEEAVPVEVDTDLIIKPHSRIITKKVLKTAKEAGSREHRLH